MIRAFSLTIIISLCVIEPGFARVTGAIARGPNQPRVEDLANDALDVISSRYPTPHDNYLILMCTSDREDALAKDSDIGAFVRYMGAAGSDLAVVVMPSRSNAGSTFVVYFKGGRPLGLVAVTSSQSQATDEVVEKAYLRLTDSVPKLKRRPVYEAGVIKADDGTEIYALKIAGWQ